MGPLGMSAKQHREYLKLQSQEQREQAKMERDESRKNQLHEIKLKEAAAKANQGIGHKEDLHAVKLKELGSPLGKPPKINKQKLGIPTQNPMADTGMFKQGQHKLYAQGTDTVPAMLTPGEAVIPAPAAQNPKNKEAIKAMVKEGRQKNALRDGAVQVVNSDVPSLAYEHPDVPGSSFEDGTERVYDFNRGSAAQANYNDGTYGVVPQQVQQAVGYNGGVTGVPNFEELYGAANDLGVDLNRDEVVYPSTQVADAGRRAGWQVSDQTLGNNQPVNWIPNSEQKAAFVAPSQGRRWKAPIQGYELSVPTSMAQLAGQENIPKVAINADVPLTEAQLKQRNINVPTGVPLYMPPVENNVPSVDASNKPAIPVTANPQAIVDEAQRQMTVAERHNNPGNLMFVGQAGAEKGEPKAGGGFWAKFPDHETGRMALENQIKLDTQTRGMSLDQFMNKYAPPKDKNDTGAYITTIANDLGIKPTDKVPAELIPKLADTITRVESGGKYRATNQGRGVFNQQAGMDETVPVLASQEQPSTLLETNPQGAETAISNVAKQEHTNLDKLIAAIKASDKTPEVKQQEAATLVEQVYGDKGIFNQGDLIRFALVAAGGMLTGGSVGGSLKFAGLNTLQSSDKRQSEQFASEQQDKRFTQQETLQNERFNENERLTRLRAELNSSKDRFYQSSKRNIDSAEAEGLITPAIARQLHNQAAAGNYLAVEKVLGSTDYATPHYLHGLPKDAKSVNVVEHGFTTPRKAFYNPDRNEYIFFNTDSKGKTVTSVRSADDFQQVNSGDVRGQRLQSFKTDLLSNSLFKTDPKTNKGVYFDIGANDVMAQLEEWSSEQKRNKQKDDYSAPELANTVNNALRVASQSGDRKPNIAKYLSLGLINSKALADPEIITGKDNKALNSAQVASIVSDVKDIDIKDKEGKRISPTVFMDNVSSSYYAQKDNKLSPDQLAELVRNKTSDKLYNKIKGAPNPYWAYMYYQVALSQPKK